MKPSDLYNLPFPKFINEIKSIVAEYDNGRTELLGRKHGYYPFISNKSFVHMNFTVREIDWASKFLDVGCGIGWTLAVKKYLNPHCQVFGIEYSDTIKVSEKLFGFKIGRDVFHEDAFEHRKIEELDDFDTVIYYYMPIMDVDIMRKLYFKMGSIYTNSKHFEVLPDALYDAIKNDEFLKNRSYSHISKTGFGLVNLLEKYYADEFKRKEVKKP